MEGEVKGKTFKMKGHTLPGINQRSEGNTDLSDGRSKSSTFQDMVSFPTARAAATAHNDAHESGKDPHGSSALQQNMPGVMGATGNIAQAVQQQRNPITPGGVGGMTGLGGGGTMLPGTSTFMRKSSVAKDKAANAYQKFVKKHNAKAATEQHFGDPHGPKPSMAKIYDKPKGKRTEY